MIIDSIEKIERDLKAFKKELKTLEERKGVFGLKLNLKSKGQKQFHKDRIEATKSYIKLFERKLKEAKNEIKV